MTSLDSHVAGNAVMEQSVASAPSSEPRARLRDRLLRWALLGALLVQLTWMLNVYPHWKDTNAASRVYLALAIVQHGTLQIDKCLTQYGDTLDKAQYKGRYYSDKAPGTSFLFVPAVWLLTAADVTDMRHVYYFLRLFYISLPAIGFWMLTLRWFRQWTGREDLAVAVVAAGAMGTNFAVYSTHLFAHVPAACLLFLSFLAARRGWTGRADGSFLAALVAGALAGAAFLNDYVAMPVIAVMGIALFFAPRLQWRQPLAFALGLAPSISVWMAYNSACFEHPLHTGFLYHALPMYGEAYRSGFLGIQSVDPASISGMLFSPARGMCFVSPVLVLAPIGWYRQIRSGEGRGDALFALAACAGLFAFSATTVDWRGGWGIGPRYLVAAVPFALIGVAGAVRGRAATDAVSVAFAGLASVGMLHCAAAALTVPLLPQDFDNPLFTLCWSLLRDGYVGPHLGDAEPGSIAGLLPYGIAVALGLCLVLSAGPASSAAGRLAAIGASVLLASSVLAVQSRMPEPPQEQVAREGAKAAVLARLGYFDAAFDVVAGLSAEPPSAEVQKEVNLDR